MKTLLLSALSLTVMALAGCGKQTSDENTPGTPEMANPAGGQPPSVQPMPGAEATNNAVVPTPSVATNNPTATNATGTTTNQ